MSLKQAKSGFQAGAQLDDGVLVEEGSRGRGSAHVSATTGGGRRSLDRAARRRDGLEHGAVVIAAITSCTNTSNPSVMIGAGLRGEKSGRARADAASRG